jgi:hypothetical protein
MRIKRFLLHTAVVLAVLIAAMLVGASLLFTGVSITYRPFSSTRDLYSGCSI